MAFRRGNGAAPPSLSLSKRGNHTRCPRRRVAASATSQRVCDEHLATFPFPSNPPASLSPSSPPSCGRAEPLPQRRGAWSTGHGLPPLEQRPALPPRVLTTDRRSASRCRRGRPLGRRRRRSAPQPSGLLRLVRVTRHCAATASMCRSTSSSAALPLAQQQSSSGLKATSRALTPRVLRHGQNGVDMDSAQLLLEEMSPRHL